MADKGHEAEFRDIQQKAEQARSFAHKFAAVNQVPHHEAIRVAEQMDQQLVNHPHFESWKAVNQEAARKLEASVSRANEVNSRGKEKDRQKGDKEPDRD